MYSTMKAEIIHCGEAGFSMIVARLVGRMGQCNAPFTNSGTDWLSRSRALLGLHRQALTLRA